MKDKDLKTFVFVFDPKHFDMLQKLRKDMRMNYNEIIEMLIERLYYERNKIQK